MKSRLIAAALGAFGLAAAFTPLSSTPADASCVDFERNPGRFINNCGQRVVVTWTDEFACSSGCRTVLRVGESGVVASSRGRVTWNVSRD